jgi:hypothetical protein
MKKTLFAFTILTCAVTFNVHAWSMWEINGAKMDINGKDIRVASVKTIGNGHVFHAKDKELEKGVYVICTQDFTSSDVLPHTTALVRDYLRTRGVNVVDKIEQSSVALKFEVRDLNIDKGTATPENQQTEYSNNAAATVATQAVLAKTVGVVAGLSYGMSSGHYEGDEMVFSSLSIFEPTPEKIGFDSEKFSRDQNGVTARTAVKQSDSKTTTADLLTLMAKVWADKYFVKN